jgi:predicted aldo/keto reductase-like oxidoreductase
MKYRRFGNLGIEVSALGFGAMRFPTESREDQVDEERAVGMMRYAFDHGVNYVDTAYPYHGGKSEGIVGKALRDGYRDRVLLATKMPIWLVERPSDFERLFTEQLERLETDRIDCYLLHNLQRHSWPKIRDLGITDWAEKAKEEGRIRYFGFSFHDSFEILEGILEDYGDWSFCQIQYNYVNEDVQAGTRGLELAAGKGLGVVVMEPLFGGILAKPPEPLRRIFSEARPQRSAADWALQWLWNKLEISVVLSGMSTIEQVEENVASAEASGIGSLSPEELETVRIAAARYGDLHPIPCTKCGYCMPCPNGVDIPKNFELYNDAAIPGHNGLELNRNLYTQLSEERRAESCIQCRQCEELCPQHIPIADWMPKVHRVLGEKLDPG